MGDLFTVSTLFNALILVVGWSIKQELKHIGDSIEGVKESADYAHKRIDNILINERP